MTDDDYDWQRDAYLSWLWWCAWEASGRDTIAAEELWRRWKEEHLG